jgi:hypothetical protein
MGLSQKITATLAVMMFAVPGLLPASANAAPFSASRNEACKGANLQNDPSCADNDLSGTIKTVVNILSAIVGVAAVIMIIIGGFRYITASGDSGSISSAKNTIIYALVGVVIATLAQVIVRFVLGRF